MSSLAQAAKVALILTLACAIVVVCGPPKTVTETMTEAEFNAEGFVYDEKPFVADFQPGKIVLNGESEGEKAVIELGVHIVDGSAAFKLLGVSVGEKALPQELFEIVDTDLSVVFHTPDDGYAVTDIAITDDELTVTATLQ